MSIASPIDRMDNSGSAYTVAIAILSWNQRDTTLQCLRSLVEADYPPSQVVVWDNGSTDGTDVAVADEFPAIIFYRSEKNLGVASGRNAVAKLAYDTLHSDYILFLDNDMQVTPGFLEALLEPFADENKLAQTTAKILTMDNTNRIDAAGGSIVNFASGTIVPVGYGEVDTGQFDTTRKCLPGGGGTMVRMDVFSMLSGFDPIFDPYGPEDLDFSFRVREAGYYGRYVPEAVIYHDHHRSVSNGKFDETYASNKLQHWMILLQRYAMPSQKIGFFLFGGPIGAVRITFRELSRRNPGAIKGILSGIWRYCAGRWSR